MPMVAYRKSRGMALQILNISTTLRWVISCMPWLLYSQESGPIPTVYTAGWAPGLVQTGTLSPSQPLSGWRYDCSIQEGKITKIILHEDFMWHLFHFCILVSYDSWIYLHSKLHKALSKNMYSWITYIFLTTFHMFCHCISLRIFHWSQHILETTSFNLQEY
jgi:hypothetical protein